MLLRPTHSRVIMRAAITGRDSTARYSAMRAPHGRVARYGAPYQEAMAISLSDLDCSHFRSSLITGYSQCPAACLKGAISGSRTYSITSLAPASREFGRVRPNTFAVLRLMTNSYFVGCSIGRSLGFSPLRILSTYVAAR